MQRRAFTLAGVLAATLSAIAPARGQEDMRIAPQYVQGLRERGYFDLADEYLEKLRTSPDTPAGLRATIDYEQGRVLIDEASRTGDLVLRKELLIKAGKKLDAFTAAQPKHRLAPDAFVQAARLLVERGHIAMIDANEVENPKEKEAKHAAARKSFDDARIAYARADEKLTAAFKAFPFIPDAEKEKKAQRDRTHNSMMDAQLQKGVVEYEEAQTYPLGSKERTEYLAKGLEQFEDIYKRYRTQFAGLTARMWQAKCFEERGDLGPAMGIYNELMEHPDPRVRRLQLNVGYFQTILYNKRKEYPLAILGAQGWLRTYTSRIEQESDPGLGVRLEAAKALLAQAAIADDDVEKARNKAQAIDLLRFVIRFGSPHKAEVLKLFKVLKPNAAANLLDIARLNYEDAMSQADEAISEHSWDKAIVLLKQAVRKTDPAKDPDKANLPRHSMAFCYYMNKQYYEADVLSEHLARRYPRLMSPKAAEIGMASLSDAYNAYAHADRESDLKRLIDLATYAANTWPDKPEGDLARLTLEQIYHGFGQYPKAIESFKSIKPQSPKWLEAQTKLGASHWVQSLALRRKGDATVADEEVKKALDTLNGALKTRRETGSAATDPELISNVCDIAEIELDTGKSAEALALLDPVAKAQTMPAGAAYSRLISNLLRAHVTTGAVDLALADMASLEKAGGSNLTQLYFTLGRLLEKEMETQRTKGDSAALARIQAAYQKFLGALVAAKAGQTYESLQWAGEQMLKLQNSKEAAEVFQRILDTVGKNQEFLAQAGSGERLLRTNLKLAAALRGKGDFDAAETKVAQLLLENPKALEPMLEKGMLLEDKASAGKGPWTASSGYWRKLALRLGGMRPRPVEYYEAWYHAAYALSKDKKGTIAKQTLNSVMRLSSDVGGKEMKAKYVKLMQNIK